KARPGADREIEFPRGRVVGGSSAVNAAMAIRGVPADYNEWAELGNLGWGWSDVLPYFRRLEDDRDVASELHGQSGRVRVGRWQPDELLPLQRAYFDVCRSLGFGEVADHNDPAATGVGPWPMNTQDGMRMSAAICYLGPARGRPNLTIKPNCLVD